MNPPARPRRIWLTAKGYAPDEGGMQTYAEACAAAWARTGAAVTVVTQTSRGPRDMDGPVRIIDLGPGKGIGNAIAWRRAIAALLARESGPPDLCHATTWRTALAPVALGLSPVVSFHGREYMGLSPVATAMLRLVVSRARACVAVSDYSARALQQVIGPRPVTVAWNGTSSFVMPRPADAPRDPGPPRLLSLCRLEPRKNIPALARALKRLADEGMAFEAIIAGRGPDQDAVARAAGGCAAIRLTGFVPTIEARALYARADIFAHPQLAIDKGRDFEGFGIAIADAMACGAAVIVGRSGGAPELIEDGVSGLLVDGTDDAALRCALRRLIADPEATAVMGQAARRRAGLFDWNRHVALCDQAAR